MTSRWLTILFFTSALFASANWPQFRGSQAMGTAESADLPETWTHTDNIAWKAAVPGMGWSSPVVWGDKIFLTTAISSGKVEPVKQGLYFGGERPKPTDVHEWRVVCLNRSSGKLLWQQTIHKGVPSHARHLKNSYASETPVVDADRVFAYVGNIGLFTYDHAGNLLWKRQWKPVKTRNNWGTAASPYLHGGRIYVINDNDDQSFLEALDAQTGKTIWRVDRDEPSNWSPPYVWTNSLRTEIVTIGSKKVRSYDLDGTVLWTASGLSSITTFTPFAHDGLLYFGSGYVGDKRRPFIAVRPGGSGHLTSQNRDSANGHIAWIQDKISSYMPTPLYYKDRIYVLLDRGMLSCYDAKTGKQIYYRQRLGRAMQFTASPIVANGKIYCASERGDVVVIQAGDTFKILQTNSIGDELIMSTPAIVNNSLILRTASHLYCIKKR